MSTERKTSSSSPTESTAPSERFAFAEFRLEIGPRQLFKDNVRVPITTKAFDTLLALVRRRGEIASKDELISEVWPDTFVSDDSLTQNISSLRRLLEDDPAQPRFIATVAKRGYRFIAPVTTEADSALEGAGPRVAAPRQPVVAVREGSTDPNASRFDLAAVSAPTPSRPRRWGLQWAFVVLVLLAGVAAGLLLSANRGSPSLQERRLRFAPELPPESTLASGGVVSPDGRHVAFIARDRQSGETKLWIRTLSTATTYAVPGSDGAVRPFWAPDNRSIAFFGGNRLRRATLTGGVPMLVCDTLQPRPAGGTWNERAEILFADAGALMLVAAEGGEPRTVLEPSATHNELTLGWPQFLPGGRRFLYEATSTDEAQAGVYVGSLDHAVRTKLLDVTGAQVAYTRGYLIYVREGRLFARGFDPESARFTGEPFLVVDETSPNASVSAATDAVIAFGGGASEELAQFDREGRVAATVSGVPPLRNLSLSPDEKMLIGEAIEPGRRGVWLIDLMRRVPTFLIGDGTFPLWLPDGRTVAFAAAREPGPVGLYLRNMDSGTDDLLLKTPLRPIASDVSPDGQFVVYALQSGTNTRQDIWLVSRRHPSDRSQLIASTAREIHPEISPDGRWFAYASDEEGPSFEVYVDAFPRLGHKKRVSTNGGTQPQWRGDGKELFYLAADQTLMSVDVVATRGLELSTPRPLFRPMLLGLMTDFRNQYTVTSDGQTFFVGVASQSGAREPITLIVNWRGSTD